MKEYGWLDVVVTDPEEMIGEGYSADELLNGGLTDEQINELAAELAKASPTALAKMLACNQNLAQHIVDDVEKRIVQKVWEATPDELEVIVEQAKQEKVWSGRVKAAVMRRNEMQATAVRNCKNLAALDVILYAVAKGDDGWLPATVYHAAIKNVRGWIKEANMSELDDLSDFASKWRFKHAVLPDIKERDAALIRSLSRAEKVRGDGSVVGYALKSGARQELVNNARRALRMIDSGRWEAMEN